MFFTAVFAKNKQIIYFQHLIYHLCFLQIQSLKQAFHNSDRIPIYAALKQSDNNWQLFASLNGGVSWDYQSTLDEGLFSSNSISVSTKNPYLVIYGGINAYRSTDGGKSFNKINDWWEYYGNISVKLHADIPGIQFHVFPDGKERVFFSTDGGTYVSEDNGLSVLNISLQGLRVSQYYDALTDINDPSAIALGSQDQGYQHGQIISNGLSSFDQLISGDYGHLVSSARTHNIVYSVYPGFVLVQKKDNSLFQIDFPTNANLDWMPFLMADPSDQNTFYLAGSHLYRYQKRQDADVWDYQAIPYDFEGRVSAVAYSPVDMNRWYAITNNGKFFVSNDRGNNWLNGASGLPFPHYFYGAYIWSSRENKDIVFVAGSGYSNPGVFVSYNGGQSFDPLGLNQPQTLFFEITETSDSNLYAATENGPYVYRKNVNMWESILETAAPMTTYWCVEALVDRVRFCTYGRGMWDYYPSGSPNISTLIFSGDYNGDGRADLIWHHGSTGQVYGMLLDGYNLAQQGMVYTESNTAWRIVGNGDFDGNGNSDLLWWNSATGQVYEMLMNGLSIAGGAVIYQEPNTTWQIVAVGDLNGDRKADLVWWNDSSGQVYGMLMNGTGIAQGAMLYQEPNTAWRILVARDFNADGKADLLWRNTTTGQIYLMLMNGLSIAGGALVYHEPNLAWRIAAVGDLNGDAKADLVWWNNQTGQVYGMLMNGTGIAQGGMLYQEANTAWQIVAGGDYNGDGKTDLLWRNSTTGQVYEMIMNGLSVAGGAQIYQEANPDWRILATAADVPRLPPPGVDSTPLTGNPINAYQSLEGPLVNPPQPMTGDPLHSSMLPATE